MFSAVLSLYALRDEYTLPYEGECSVMERGLPVFALVCQPFYSGGYGGGVPPLPIPNREVKPACADGTAMQCGRVGGRHYYSET